MSWSPPLPCPAVVRSPATQLRRAATFDVKMTPMIDVVFLLLIFFVCTTSFRAHEQSLPTNLLVPGQTASPVAVDPQLEELEEVIVRLRGQAEQVSWQVNDRPCDHLSLVRQILATLAQVDVQIPVVLDVASEIHLGRVVELYDLCREVGFQRIQFAARSTSVDRP